METIRVTLADAPTDVLIYLVDTGPRTAGEIVGHFEAIHDCDVHLTVVNALALLEDAEYACYNGHTWAACTAGIEAVERAR